MKSQRDIAGFIGVTPMTLRNWRREKQNLYKIIMLGLKFQELIEESKKHHEELLQLEEEVNQELRQYQQKKEV